MDWYTISNMEEVDTPALVLYPDRIEHNIAVLKTIAPDPDRLRPHVKTNKCPRVCRMMLDAGISRFKCATIAEAEMLAMEGAPDVLLAYQPSAPKLQRFCKLQRKYPRTLFSCLIDNHSTLAMLSAVASEQQSTITVFIDLNVGMNRTGIKPGHQALQLYLDASAAGNVRVAGLHAYDGHIRDADLGIRKQKCDEAFAPVISLREQIRRATGKDPVVVAGGTPTFPIHAQRTDVQASPGTFIFWDKGYQQSLAEQPFWFGALVVARVISLPDEVTVCTDLGHKSIASENPLSSRVVLLNAPDLEPAGHSEEHMVFRAGERHSYKVGDVLYGVPFHICPTVALYDEAGVCRDHQVRENWPILSRKRKISI